MSKLSLKRNITSYHKIRLLISKVLRGKKSQVNNQRSQVTNKKTEVNNQNTEVNNQKTEVKMNNINKRMITCLIMRYFERLIY